MSNGELGPGPYTIERVVSAWQRAQAELAADDMLAGDEAVVNLDGSAAGLDVDAVLTRIISAMLFAALRAAEADELAKTFRARKARYEKREDMLRRELLDLLLVLDRPKFVSPLGTISTRRIPASLLILDAEAIPKEYLTETVVTTPNRKAIEADLAEGVVIAGAAMSNGGVGLTYLAPRAKRDAEPAKPETN